MELDLRELGARFFGTPNSLAYYRKSQPQYLTPINILACLILTKQFFLGGWETHGEQDLFRTETGPRYLRKPPEKGNKSPYISQFCKNAKY